jgi:hypothetical protein
MLRTSRSLLATALGRVGGAFFSFGFVLELVFFLSSFRCFLFISPPCCTFPSSARSSSLRSLARLSAPAPTCAFPFWERPLFFPPRSRYQLRAGLAPSRRWFLHGVGAATREELGRGGVSIF